MDKQQKLEYQKKIETYLAREHVYDLFEELTKQLVVKQPDDPISFLIDRLSTPQSTASPKQRRRSSSSVLRGSKSASSHSRSQTITSLRRFPLAICCGRKYRRSSNWARKSNPTSNTSQWCGTKSSRRWSSAKWRRFRRRRKASSFRATRAPESRA